MAAAGLNDQWDARATSTRSSRPRLVDEPSKPRIVDDRSSRSRAIIDNRTKDIGHK